MRTFWQSSESGWTLGLATLGQNCLIKETSWRDMKTWREFKLPELSTGNVTSEFWLWGLLSVRTCPRLFGKCGERGDHHGPHSPTLPARGDTPTSQSGTHTRDDTSPSIPPTFSQGLATRIKELQSSVINSMSNIPEASSMIDTVSWWTGVLVKGKVESCKHFSQSLSICLCPLSQIALCVSSTG